MQVVCMHQNQYTAYLQETLLFQLTFQIDLMSETLWSGFLNNDGSWTVQKSAQNSTVNSNYSKLYK